MEHQNPVVIKKENFLKFVIYMDPVPKGRARFSFNSKRVYTPGKTAKAEKLLRHIFMLNGYPRPEPVILRACFYFKRPKSKKHLGLKYKTSRGDGDNFLKLLMDSGNEYLWNDDAQIVHGTFKKMWTDGEPRVEFAVRYLCSITK